MKSLEIEQELALLDTILDNAPIGFAFIDRDFKYRRVNRALAQLDGRTEGDSIGKTVAEFFPRLWPAIEPIYRRTLAGETILNHKISGLPSNRNGPARHWLASYYPVRLAGQVIGIGVVINDVTNQKIAEQALSARTDLYAMLSRTNRAIFRCRSGEELFGEICTIAIEIGRFCFACVSVPDGSKWKKVAHAGDDRGYLDRIADSRAHPENLTRGPTGEAYLSARPFVANDLTDSSLTDSWCDNARRVGFASSAAFPFSERGRVAAVFTLYSQIPGFFTDELLVTLSEIMPSVSLALDRLLSEADRIRDEAELLLRDRAIRAVSQGILIMDAAYPDQPIIYASPGFERLTGYAAAEVIGRNCRFMQGKETDPAIVAQLRGAIQEGRSCTVEMINYRKGGAPFWNSLTVSPILDAAQQLTHFVGVLTDVTERRQLEEQFRQAQKMEAIGLLAGGVAHDFNNQITIICGYADLVLSSLAPEDPTCDAMRTIIKAGEISSGLTHQLLAFSRKQILTPTILNLNDVVRGLETMLKRIIGENIELATVLAPNLDSVKADFGQLEQVLLNLVINARDSMSEGGKLTIETANVEFDALYSSNHLNIAPGHYVMVAVTDSGSGMSSDVQKRIFEPFFTTKPTGQGTGLGLSVVHGVIRQTGGHIQVYSELGCGTCFKIYLPQNLENHHARPLPIDHDFVARGSETILLVEDEDALRTLAKNILVDRGYTVLDAKDADRAEKIAAQHFHDIHLLLTDVVMPGASGRILAERLLALRPHLKVLYISGYTADGIVRHGILHETVNFLQKPFSPTSLAQKVRDILNQPSSVRVTV